MDGERKSCTERILNAIEYGKLSNDETERRLFELVEGEVNKTDSESDLELIKACQSLIWQLHTHGVNLYDSHYNANKAKIDQRIRRKIFIANTAQAVGKTLVATVAAILLFVGVRFSWFEHSDTLDGQQHVITGQEITLEMVQRAIAEHANTRSFETTDLHQLQTMIGFDPDIPETIMDQWYVSTCSVLILRNSIQVTSVYNNLSQEASTLIYVKSYYTNVDDSYLVFEQSEKGKESKIGGHVVYFSNNVDRMVACWCKENVINEIGCSMEEEVFKKLVQQLLKEEHN